MKKIFTIIILGAILGFSACSEDETPDQQIIGTWELTETIGSWPVDIPEGEADYFVSYQFRQDGTFQKTQDINGTESSASGTYTIDSTQDEIFALLTFSSPSEIIQSCNSNATTESVTIVSNNRLEVDTSPCDGPKNIFAKR
ncbi:lipocalin family protein [Belliella kenyensis]|uniref:Lipocalin family protein n=1 Tax=Belliella kenyensis TaxID=1472724 RepID=A0ABV8EP58_9BACT|nr:lipocalin family protein [Belliella kenyensis]MCH7401633.1 lipocalin family protein [Belliella kenyensis]MDN3603089.1 lipocalin family protein [Belliella kenyensis]